MERKVSIAITLVFLFIAVIVAAIEQSVNSFFTWFFIGTWILFTIKFYEKIKQAREFNSPHNTSFFTLGPIIAGNFYNFWGYYSTFLNQNLLEGSNLFLSVWTIVFAFPYLLFSNKITYNCFKKYNVAYIYKTTSVKARSYGYFCSILLIALGITTLLIVGFYGAVVPFNIVHHDLDIMLLYSIFVSGYLFIVPGIMGRQESLPQITPEYIAQRRRAVNRIAAATPTPSRSPRRSSRTSSSSSSQFRTRRSPSTTSSTPRTTQRSKSKKTTKPTSTSRSKTTSKPKSRPKKKINYHKYKPKTGALTIDDFKCIFCFELPKLPEDAGRRIVLCPNCNYPAHEDEFKDWMRTSNLCSRCDSQIPQSFQRNPRSMKVENYLRVIKHFTKKR